MCAYCSTVMENLVASELTQALTGAGEIKNETPEARGGRIRYKTGLLVCAAVIMLGQGLKEILSSELLFQTLNNYINSTRQDQCDHDHL